MEVGNLIIGVENKNFNMMKYAKKISRWKKVRTVETERIVNIAELEQIVRDARVDIISLKKALKNGNKEASKHLTEQLDLKLHRMEAFEFVLERRTMIL